MHQNEFSFEVLYAMIARILFSGCCNIVWCIKTNFLFKYCMQYLQEYDFLHIVMHQNTFCFEVYECSNIARLLFSTWWNIVWYIKTMYAVIARVLFSSCWDILWCIKTNLVWRCQMQWLQEYSFSSCLDILWCIKTNFLLKYCMQWLQECCFLHVGNFADESKRI